MDYGFLASRVPVRSMHRVFYRTPYTSLQPLRRVPYTAGFGNGIPYIGVVAVSGIGRPSVRVPLSFWHLGFQ